jgi:hypothetical protein
VTIEPELDPYFSIEQDFPSDDGPAWAFQCRVEGCGAVWTYPKRNEQALEHAEYHDDEESFLDKGSRNALLAHARSHRAPRLKRVERKRGKPS